MLGHSHPDCRSDEQSDECVCLCAPSTPTPASIFKEFLRTLSEPVSCPARQEPLSCPPSGSGASAPERRLWSVGSGASALDNFLANQGVRRGRTSWPIRELRRGRSGLLLDNYGTGSLDNCLDIA